MKEIVNTDWMVLYTRSRWEKKVHNLLVEQNINSFCPLVKKVNQWADRKKTVEAPLFNSYLFVEATTSLYNRILQTPGVVSFITYCGKPAIVKNEEIERIRDVTKNYTDIETVSLTNLNIGDNVMVMGGPLVNHMGEIRQIHGRSIIMIIKYMNCALTVKIDHKQLSPKPKPAYC